MLERNLESFTVLELARAIATKLKREFLSMTDLCSLIELLTSTLSYAQSCLNAQHTLIGRMPDEILRSIFLSGEQFETNREILWPSSSRIRDRFTVTRVCRQWRNVALSCRVLWADIHFDNTNYDLACRLLQRSKEAPVHLTVKTAYCVYLKTPIIQDCLSRLQELHIVAEWDERDMDWKSFQECFFPTNGCTAPQLERFTFAVKRGDDICPPTNAPLLLQHAPNLNRLFIKSVYWLKINRSKCLTHLSLVDCTIASTSLMNLLSTNPGLQELILVDCCAVTNVQPPSASLFIQLNHMRRLVLSDYTDGPLPGWMLWLLQHVEFGTSTSVRLDDPSFSGVLENLRITGRRQMQDIDMIALTSDSARQTSTIGVIKGSELGFCVDDIGLHEVDLNGISTWRFDSLLLSTPNPFPSVRELWLPLDLYSGGYLDAMICSFPALETLILYQEDVSRLRGTPFRPSRYSSRADQRVPSMRLNLKAVHIFLHHSPASLAYRVVSLAQVLAARSCQPLTVFNIGFPDSDMLENFRASDGFPFPGHPVLHLKLFSDMPALKIPQASRTADHAYWPPWGQSFPLNFFK